MSNRVSEFWNGSAQGVRLSIIVATAVAIAGLAWLAVTLLADDYGVLFSDLNEGDAASIVAQLKKQKVPYRLSDGGTTVAVPDARVHETRLTLMASDVPLAGGVGFEIFDKQGLGATEQAQKVSYQRALQGELSRTIGALDNVKHVRVHLVMPESTLFTRDRQEASAAVTVATRTGGSSLDKQQIVGIQRLVAAAVPGLETGRVVVTDQRGITLSANDSVGNSAGGAETRLDTKRQVEDYVAHKIVRLLDGAFGPGQAIVSVDATLNFNATKTTIRDLLPGATSAAGEGRVVRRRQVTGASSGEPLWTNALGGSAATTRTPGSSSEVEYEYGQRIDEIIAGPGALARLSVGVIVPGDIDEVRRSRIAELVRTAAGITDERGDAISIQSLEEMQAGVTSPAVELEAESADAPTVPHSDARAHTGGQPMRLARPDPWIILLGIATLFAFALLVVLHRRSRPAATTAAPDRERVLQEIERLLSEESVRGSGKVRA